MFKKASKIAVSFALLVGAYLGYTRLFAIVTAQLGQTREDVGVAFLEIESKWARKANELARESFPQGHWAASKGLKLQYYDAIKGCFMYAQEKEFLDNGKRIHVWPFAIIWISKDGKSRKSATSNEAIIDVNNPIMSAKVSTEPSKVTHARLIGDVRLRDDKGTLDDPSDDLRVGPLTDVEFDDKTLQITTDSDVFLQDRDLTLTGLGLMIQLRRKVGSDEPGVASPTGFDAETAFVYKDVHLIVNDASSDGVLPGPAKPEKKGKTPIDVRSDREMRIDLPPPHPRILVGPPNPNRPPNPTLVKFRTNVRVVQGTEKTQQLNCDTLDLTLMPDPRKIPAETDLVGVKSPDAPEEGPLTELKIRSALARGDAVWLQSESQGMVARCVELKYEKHAHEGLPDITYLNGGTGKKLWVEKVDFDSKAPTPGAIKSIMVLTSLDATIFDSGPGGSTKVIARGPGKTVERPARNASVSRTVWWEDEMELLTWHDGDGPNPTPSPLAVRALSSPRPAMKKGTLRRLLTLTGVSKLVDHESGTALDARKSIVAEFQAEPKGELWLDSVKDKAELPTSGKGLVVVGAVDGRVAFRIFDESGRMIVDLDELGLGSKAKEIGELRKQLAEVWPPHEMTSNEKGRIIAAVTSIVAPSTTADLAFTKGEGPAQIKWLDAYEDAHLTAPSKALTARHFLKAKFETAPAPPVLAAAPSPVPAAAVAIAADPVASPPSGPSVADASTSLDSRPEAAPAPTEPNVDGRADRVWANLLLGATGDSGKGSKGELKSAQLRGGVMVHQDPAVGKAFGSDASGEALDLTAQGKGLMKFVVKAEEPQAFDLRTKLASDSKVRKPLPTRIARVQTEGKTIESEDIIGVDQALDFAWSQGAGIFIQMAARGLLDDKGLDGEKSKDGKAGGPAPQDQLAITWNEEMRFYGRSIDLEGRPSAKVEFRGASKLVRTPDGRREFRRGVEAKMTDSAIFTDTMDVYMDKLIAFNKSDKKPEAGQPKEPDPQIAMLDCKGKNIVEQGIITFPGVDIISQKLFPESGEMKEKQRIQGEHVLYEKSTGNFYTYGPGVAWIYRRKGGNAKADDLIPTALPVSSPSNGRTRPEVVSSNAKKLTPIELTKVRFAEGMRGRFGVAKDKTENENREAEFVGNVQAANATVQSKNGDIDFDRLEKWPDNVFLTSDVLDIFSEPSAPGSKSANRQLLHARGNGLAKAKFDIIQADRITYDSATSLTYAYGEDGKDVAFTQQNGNGLRPSTSRMKTLRYNKNTGESSGDDPHAISFTDLKTGIRSKSFFPDLGGTPKPLDPIKLPRTPLQRQGRVSTERSGFTGH